MTSKFVLVSYEETVTLMSTIAASYAAAGDHSIDCVTLLESGNDEHPNAKHYASEDGTVVFSVDYDGYIYAVLANTHVSPRTSGSDALAEAKRVGGRYLDSYSRNVRFYTKNGFERVARDAVNPDYADPNVVGNDYLYFVLPEYKERLSYLQSAGDAMPAEDRYDFFTGELNKFFAKEV